MNNEKVIIQEIEELINDLDNLTSYKTREVYKKLIQLKLDYVKGLIECL